MYPIECIVLFNLHKMSIFYSENKDTSNWFGDEFHALHAFCAEPGSALTVNDANGDGYDDLYCHPSTGGIQISESHIVDKSMFRDIMNEIDESKTERIQILVYKKLTLTKS